MLCYITNNKEKVYFNSLSCKQQYNMNNLLTTLSFSIYFNKGVYALLLGSGISRSAGIPTGWNIVTDLIHKLAVQYGTSNIDNPEKWFEEQNRILNQMKKK